MERYAGRPRKGRPARVPASMLTVSLTMIYVVTSSCDPPVGMGNGFLRFGQDGEIRVSVEAPLQGGVGWLQQVLTWNSDGAWKLFEEIGYRGTVGEEGINANPGLPLQFAGSYATLITQLNDHDGSKLLGVPDLDADLNPDCGVGASRVTVLIRDAGRNQDMEWVRCAFGTLGSLVTQGSGPDFTAGRVIQAAILARNFTLGDEFLSAYAGSLPFYTVEKGTETGSGVEGPRVFRAPDNAGSDETPPDWALFWGAHAGAGRPLPEVDWASEMVLVGAVGVREEVGDSVEIRRVLPIGTGTRVEIFERIPGNFCAPARRIVRPFHIIVAPRAPAPVVFTDVKEERVPCGT